MRAIALCLLLSGCLTLPHKVEHVAVNGRPVEVHTDHPADPCPEGAQGCYATLLDAVFLRSPVYAYIRKHELGHAAGMRHGEWDLHPTARMYCAAVTVAGGGYAVGQTLCVDGNSERVIQSAFTRG